MAKCYIHCHDFIDPRCAAISRTYKTIFMTMLEFYQSEETEKEDMALNNLTLFSSETNLNAMLDSYYMESAFIECYYKTNGNHKEIIQLLSQFN